MVGEAYRRQGFPVEESLGGGADGRIAIAAGRFTREAQSFADGKTLELIDGSALLALVHAVRRETASHVSPRMAGRTILHEPFAPVAMQTCPECDAPMVRRTARKGPNAGDDFRGCSTHPHCRGVINT